MQLGHQLISTDQLETALLGTMLEFLSTLIFQRAFTKKYSSKGTVLHSKLRCSMKECRYFVIIAIQLDITSSHAVGCAPGSPRTKLIMGNSPWLQKQSHFGKTKAILAWVRPHRPSVPMVYGFQSRLFRRLLLHRGSRSLQPLHLHHRPQVHWPYHLHFRPHRHIW